MLLVLPQVMGFLEEGTRKDAEQAWAEFSSELITFLELSFSRANKGSSDFLKRRCNELTKMLKQKREERSQNFLQKLYGWLKSLVLWAAGCASSVPESFWKMLASFSPFAFLQEVGAEAAKTGAELMVVPPPEVPKNVGFLANLEGLLPLFHLVAILASAYDIAVAATELQRSRGPSLSSDIRVLAEFIRTTLNEIRPFVQKKN